MDAVTVAWQLVKGQPCCCGDDTCDGGWPDRWTWVARSGRNATTGRTREKATRSMNVLLEARAEGRFPDWREMVNA